MDTFKSGFPLFRHFLLILLLYQVVLPDSKAQNWQTHTHTVYFKIGEYSISESQQVPLKQFINQISKLEDRQWTVEGHTCNIGDSLSNIRLSENRAVSVIDFLTANGINEPIKVSGYGWNKPAVSNHNADGRVKNRRTEIIVRGKLPVTEDKPDPEVISERELFPVSQIYDDHRQDYQTFCIQPGRDTLIAGSRGTLIFFPADFFSNVPEECDPCIMIRLKERFNLMEMIMENLGTQTQDNILVSAGMVKVEAFCNDQQLYSDKNLTMFIPTDDPDDEMMHFTGRRDEQGNMVWEDQTEIEIINSEEVRNRCNIIGFGSRERCPFFFCKIRLFFRNLFVREEPDEDPPETGLPVMLPRLVPSAACWFLDGSNMAETMFVAQGVLGWNNIDKLLIRYPPVPLYVDKRYSNKTVFKLIVGRERAWVPFGMANIETQSDVKKIYAIAIAPKGARVHIVGIRNYGESVGYAHKEITVEENMILRDFTFSELSREEMENRLQNLR